MSYMYPPPLSLLQYICGRQSSLFAVGVQHGVSGIEILLGVLFLHRVDLVVDVTVTPATLVEEPAPRERREGKERRKREKKGE